MVRTGRLGQDFYRATKSGIIPQDILESLDPVTTTKEMWRQEITEQDEYKTTQDKSDQEQNP